MNMKQFARFSVLPLMLATGCSNLSKTENGALAGGGIGAVTGALIGKTTGHTAGGAAIGAGVGALTGGLVGNAVEKSEQRTQSMIANAQAQSQLGIMDVIKMVQAHVSDDVIINQIRSRGCVFNLSAEDTIYLKQNGVSDRVVAEMQATAARVPRRVYSSAPVYTQPVYVVEPNPPPVVGLGFGYTHVGRRW